MTPGDRVAQLYPQALGTHFIRLLRHAWVTVGLFFNSVTTQDNSVNRDIIFIMPDSEISDIFQEENELN
jgi:hypothetical protein